MQVRIDAETLKQLDECVKALNSNRSEVVRKGIEEMHKIHVVKIVQPEKQKKRIISTTSGDMRDIAYEDYKAGMLLAEIAQKYDIKPATVRQWAKRHWKENKKE